MLSGFSWLSACSGRRARLDHRARRSCRGRQAGPGRSTYSGRHACLDRWACHLNSNIFQKNNIFFMWKMKAHGLALAHRDFVGFLAL